MLRGVGALALIASTPIRGLFAGAPSARASGVGTRAKQPAADETSGLLRELILRRALGSDQPWVAMHVVLALGADVKHNGSAVLDDVIAATLKQSTVAGRAYPTFEREVERHPHHFLQILHATGVPYDRAFATPLGRFTRSDLVSGATALFDRAAINDELSWTVSVFTAEFRPRKDRLVSAKGEATTVAELVETHCRDTEAAYADSFAAREGKKPYARGMIQTKACNGTHLLYGLIDALRAGYTDGKMPERVARLVDVTVFRLEAEPALIDATLSRAGGPLARLNADAAKLTFLGHALEDLGYGIRNGVVRLDGKQQTVVTRAHEQLGGIVQRLVLEHDIDQLQVAVPQAYKLVLGDACHALRGLSFWT